MTAYQEALARLAAAGIRARTVSGINGLDVQLLEAGPATDGGRCCCCCTASLSWAIAGAG